MVKKISVEELKPGMFIHDLNCNWLNHPFFKSSLLIKNKQMIDKITGFCVREVYIDTVEAIQKIMNDVKLERQIERGRAEETANNIVESVCRNQDALIGLGSMIFRWQNHQVTGALTELHVMNLLKKWDLRPEVYL